MQIHYRDDANKKKVACVDYVDVLYAVKEIRREIINKGEGALLHKGEMLDLIDKAFSK